LNYYLRMLGLARRANAVILGIDRIETALKNNFQGTIFFSNDLGASSRNRIIRLIKLTDKIQLRELPHSREELGATQGLNSCAAIAVREGTLEHTIRNAVDKAALSEEGG